MSDALRDLIILKSRQLGSSTRSILDMAYLYEAEHKFTNKLVQDLMLLGISKVQVFGPSEINGPYYFEIHFELEEDMNLFKLSCNYDPDITKLSLKK
jgi:hypothetical protein